MPPTGYLSVVLHAHLPFVRHPEHPSFLEEDWLFEAMTETYVPLLRMMDRLWADGVDFRLTMSLTPPLCEMLADGLLAERYLAHLGKLEELAEQVAWDRRETPFSDAARRSADELHEVRRLYDDAWGRRLLPVFRSFQDRGRLEIVTCGATHGFLPLMLTEEARWAQIEVACTSYERHFGRRPRGIWLPECAYAPGLDELLAEAGLRWFFVETQGLWEASPKPRYGTYRPVVTPGGPCAFARDQESAAQVWSAEGGYPGDGVYREFYRDVGYDWDYRRVRPYLHEDGVRRNVGIKLHRVTGKVGLDEKEPYVPAWAQERAEEHAGNFLFNRQGQARHLREALGVAPHLVAPYDAELFGHWWYEGPHFLEMLLRKASCDQGELRLTTPSEFLVDEPVHQEATPALSSWGEGAGFSVWLNPTNDWIYRHLHRAEERMVELVRRFPSAEGLERRALNQAARELLMAQASDWAFIMTQGTTVPYAERRTRDHVARFSGLYLQLVEGRLEERWLSELEWLNSAFPDLDYHVYESRCAAGTGRGAAVWTA